MFPCALTATSKPAFLCSIYSRRLHRDKQIGVFVLYLFAAESPRQANQHFRVLSIRGGLTATSKLAFLYFIYSRRPHRDKQTSVLVLYLFAASSPRQANRRFRALSIRGVPT